MYIILGRKKLAVICAAILFCTAAFASVLKFAPSERTFGKEYTGTVILDAGHGLPDGGAVGACGSVEADINLKIVQMLAEVLEAKGIDVVMTRQTKQGLRADADGSWSKREDMRLRLDIIRKADADLFVSVHMNHFSDPSVHGLRLFYAANHPEAKQTAERMQQKMSELTGARVNAIRAADKSLFLMKAPPVAAILVECGFISNPEEEKRLLREEYKAKLAWAMADVIESSLVNKKIR